MAMTRMAKIRRARQLIALTLLAEIKTNQRNLISLILDKATIWTEDRQALRLPPLPRQVEIQLARSQGMRLFRLREAVFSLAPKRPLETQRLIYRDDVYRPGLPGKTRKH
ncbi:hypothetical protein [Marinospirillum alkaliphilum]|uniref:Uncharacterized protein n=1 Tax=Marinospirillum alkaliphilum DSM 21637 TaxID=1122209 RepID=A0A1K1TCJ2_9GAMM|nr:hypothetical protein [Marinospirillum alkaliphilum]SFW98353.1 hypothetical protein SAMN02745752_00067 [Marinospirillum alkaliphilum DSM 21637]